MSGRSGRASRSSSHRRSPPAQIATLLGVGGVDGAIHRAAGPRLLEACREVRRTAYPNGLPTGYAVATPGDCGRHGAGGDR
ncbi:MAG: macro domain-containing protein [Acidimicrobiales bacterium]|nr:macro domain-containing protein [Acidimicrobiales bacterium]